MCRKICLFLVICIFTCCTVSAENHTSQVLEIVSDIRCSGVAVNSTISFKVQNNSESDVTSFIWVGFFKDSQSQQTVLIGTQKQEICIPAEGCVPVSFTLNEDYSQADFIKIFAWDNENKLLPLAQDRVTDKNEFTIQSKGRYATPDIYGLPYYAPTQDRLAEAMPMAFDPMQWPAEEIAFEDFKDNNYGNLSGVIYRNGAVLTDGGYDNNDGCVKIADNGYAQMNWTVSSDELHPGEWLLFTCMVKADGIEGNGNLRATISCNDADKTQQAWITEASSAAIKEDTDWVECYALMMIPFKEEITKNYRIAIQIDSYNTTAGEYWGDNYKLSRIIFHPMDTVLMSPAYKGIIKGEGGKNDIALRAYVNEENGAYDLSKMNFTAQITDDDHNVLLRSESAKVTNQMDVYFSSETLDMGKDYYLESILTDKTTGNIIQKEEWPLHKKPEDFQTFLGYDEFGRITKNGKPTMLITAMGGGTYDEIITDMIDAGCFDGISSTGLGWHYSYGADTEEQKRYRELIKELDKNEMGISVGGIQMLENNIFFDDWKKYVDDSQSIRGVYERIAHNFKDMPGMLFYTTHDELNNLQWGQQLGWNRKIIESIDLDHPTYAVIDNPIANRPGVAAKSSDFLSYDPYPVTGQPSQKIELVYERIKQGLTLNPGKPVLLCAQMFWWITNTEYLRPPNQTEYRNMVFQALCAGADGIDNYSYQILKQYPGEDGWEIKWREYTDVLRDVKELEPVLMSLEATPYYEVENGGEWLKHMIRRYNGKTYLFTVNTDPNEKTAQFVLDGVNTIKGRFSGKEYTSDGSGRFTVTLSGYETEVFEFEQAVYKSPHAELKRFALDKCVLIDSEEENSSFVIEDALDEVDYRAIISQGAKLYINNNLSEQSGKLQIKGLNSITVKVVSEDERFTIEKTYTIIRKRS